MISNESFPSRCSIAFSTRMFLTRFEQRTSRSCKSRELRLLSFHHFAIKFEMNGATLITQRNARSSDSIERERETARLRADRVRSTSRLNADAIAFLSFEANGRRGRNGTRTGIACMHPRGGGAGWLQGLRRREIKCPVSRGHRGREREEDGRGTRWENRARILEARVLGTSMHS